ncbi:MAG: hypothetical protein DMF28_03305 [Verrucomicrobia bacterium]|nr:MAG: hypothetical protein DMF28_03305 [Verrucomicrobiota bacterium]
MKINKQNLHIKIRHLTFIPVLIIGLALLPKAQAVSPPPDGGYSGGNTAEGQTALLSLTTGGFNTAVGFLSLRSNTTGGFNTAIGAGTLLANTAIENTATGVAALLSNTTGMANTATGAFALFSNTIGSANSAFGAGALFSNTTGDFNTAIGDEALFSNTSGSVNIAIGILAGSQLTTGDHNIDIDNYGVAGESGIIRIGATGVHTTTYIAGIAGQTVGAGGSFCYVDNEGKLGVFLSARRFKTDIADMAAASEGLLALRPVTFHYKPELDKTGIPQFGLVAEEVAKVNPNLVTHDAKGELSTVRYEAVNAMLLNEFLKEHRKVEEQDCRIQEQETTIAALKKQMETVVAHAKEQDSQIQKVSAQIELNKAAPQVIVTNH